MKALAVKDVMIKTSLLFYIIFLGQFCLAQNMIIPAATTVCDRFLPPPNYERIEAESSSYASFLRNLPLKPFGSEVSYYDGRKKKNNHIYDAVVDLPIGRKDLHQCADAVMRLRAEYLWREGEYDKIHFNFTNGHRIDYSKWMKGQRISVSGSKTNWVEQAAASNSYQDFWDYMELIFMYAGTASLEKELVSVDMQEMEIGDVFIKGGFPGHAVLVVDMVQHEVTGEKLYLLGQSYMPAQEFQILKNPKSQDLSPWYRLEPDNLVISPEWTFYPEELKRFEKE